MSMQILNFGVSENRGNVLGDSKIQKPKIKRKPNKLELMAISIYSSGKQLVKHRNEIEAIVTFVKPSYGLYLKAAKIGLNNFNKVKDETIKFLQKNIPISEAHKMS